jgi:pyrroloquinoline quinone biosynthesis protein E
MTNRLYTVVAELTYRCPLRCLYCSNPVDFAAYHEELTTAEWSDVFRQAAALGALQLHLSGGEPTLRSDLPDLIRAARAADLYVNLITAGTLLDESKLGVFRECGLDHIQLSLQDSNREAADMVAGVHCFDKKMEVARQVRAAGFPLTLNVVLHRHNIDRIPDLIALAIDLGADRLELANTQYYAWALQNRGALLPSREQYDRAENAVRSARETVQGKMEIAFVRSDYFADRPKPCMGGWANSYVCIAPDGRVLPCHAATVISGLQFDDVRTRSLAEIWRDSAALNTFRGDDWMIEPCRSCPNKKIDFGGCRCQAFMLTGDARAADPVCGLSPMHHVVADVVESKLATPALVYRDARNSRRLSATR